LLSAILLMKLLAISILRQKVHHGSFTGSSTLSNISSTHVESSHSYFTMQVDLIEQTDQAPLSSHPLAQNESTSPLFPGNFQIAFDQPTSITFLSHHCNCH
jgi:hypothetical protein